MSKGDRPLKVAFLGVAHMHADTYASVLPEVGGEVVAVHDGDAARAEDFASRCGCVAVHGTGEALADLHPDAVVIAGTNREHRPLLELAAALGVPAMLEKPLGVSLADARAIANLVAAERLPVFMALPMRYNSVLRGARARLRAGDLGRMEAPFGVRSATVTNHGKTPSGWFVQRREAGGGAVLDHTVHLIDALHWLTGVEPEEVFAVATATAGDVERFGFLSVRCSEGLVATLDPSWAHPGRYPIWPDLSVRLVGEDAVLTADAFRQTLQRYGDDEGLTHLLWADDEDATMVSAFLDFVRINAGAPASAPQGPARQAAPAQGASSEGDFPGIDDGMRAQRLAAAAYRSIESGRTVRLDEVDQ